MHWNKSLMAMAMAAAVALLGASHALAQEKSDLQVIRDKGVVRVGAVHAPPYYVKDPASGKWSGLVPDIAELLFGKINIKVEYVETQWGTAVAGLQSDKFDLIGAYNATPERALAIDFTRPIGYLLVGVVTLKSDADKWKSWQGVDLGTTRIAAVDGAGTTKAAESVLKNVKWVRTASNDAMLLELESGRADIILSNHPTLLKYIEARRKGRMIIPEPQLRQPTSFGLRKYPSKDLRDWLNVALAFYEADGSLEGIWQKHLPTK
jgi:polar amino acid transport system substrate-binding protein